MDERLKSERVGRQEDELWQQFESTVEEALQSAGVRKLEEVASDISRQISDKADAARRSGDDQEALLLNVIALRCRTRFAKEIAYRLIPQDTDSDKRYQEDAVEALKQVAEIYKDKLGLLEKASEVLADAYELAGDLAAAKSNGATSYSVQLARAEEAMVQYQRSVDESLEIGNYRDAAERLYNMATVQSKIVSASMKEGEWSEAQEKLRSTLSYVEQARKLYEESVVDEAEERTMRALALEIQGDFQLASIVLAEDASTRAERVQEALVNYRASLDLSKRNEDYFMVYLRHRDIINCALQAGDMEAQTRYAELGEADLKECLESVTDEESRTVLLVASRQLRLQANMAQLMIAKTTMNFERVPQLVEESMSIVQESEEHLAGMEHRPLVGPMMDELSMLSVTFEAERFTYEAQDEMRRGDIQGAITILQKAEEAVNQVTELDPEKAIILKPALLQLQAMSRLSAGMTEWKVGNYAGARHNYQISLLTLRELKDLIAEWGLGFLVFTVALDEKRVQSLLEILEGDRSYQMWRFSEAQSRYDKASQNNEQYDAQMEAAGPFTQGLSERKAMNEGYVYQVGARKAEAAGLEAALSGKYIDAVEKYQEANHLYSAAVTSFTEAGEVARAMVTAAMTSLEYLSDRIKYCQEKASHTPRTRLRVEIVNKRIEKDKITEGEAVEVSITLRNASEQLAADHVELQEVIPSEFAVRKALNMELRDGSYLWTGALAPSEQRSFDYTIEANEGASGGVRETRALVSKLSFTDEDGKRREVPAAHVGVTVTPPLRLGPIPLPFTSTTERVIALLASLAALAGLVWGAMRLFF